MQLLLNLWNIGKFGLQRYVNDTFPAIMPVMKQIWKWHYVDEQQNVWCDLTTGIYVSIKQKQSKIEEYVEKVYCHDVQIKY